MADEETNKKGKTRVDPDTADNSIDKDTSETDNNDDLVIESEDESEEGMNPAASLKRLREKLKVAVAEKQQYLDGWQRDKADFLNARKREEESRKELVRFANEDLISEIIPALDSFDMAMANKEAWEKVDKNWRIGVEYIYSQLLGALQKNGLTQDNPLGQDFNPTVHEPTELIDTTKKDEDGKILQVIQKGYLLHGKAIRPAKVKVGEYQTRPKE